MEKLQKFAKALEGISNFDNIQRDYKEFKDCQREFMKLKRALI